MSTSAAAMPRLSGASEPKPHHRCAARSVRRGSTTAPPYALPQCAHGARHVGGEVERDGRSGQPLGPPPHDLVAEPVDRDPGTAESATAELVLVEEPVAAPLQVGPSQQPTPAQS